MNYEKPWGHKSKKRGPEHRGGRDLSQKLSQIGWYEEAKRNLETSSHFPTFIHMVAHINFHEKMF